MAKKPSKTIKTKTAEKKIASASQKTIELHEHPNDELLGNPSAALANPDSRPDESSTTYAYSANLADSPQRWVDESAQNTQIAPDQKAATNSLQEFWEGFRLSPSAREHAILTDMRWLALIALGPSLLLDVLDTIRATIYYQQFDFQYLLVNFGDLLFRIATLSLFFGALIFRYYWYPTIRRAFESLLQNDVLRDGGGEKLSQSEFLGFLEEYRRDLHSRKRYIQVVLFILFIVGIEIYIPISRGYYWDIQSYGPLFWLRQVVHWILAPTIWSYVGMLWLWSVNKTAKTVANLTPRFQVKVQPLHSDQAGGLKRLGDLCSYIGLMVIVIVTPSTVQAIRGTIISTHIAPCGVELKQFVNGQANMTEDRLTVFIMQV